MSYGAIVKNDSGGIVIDSEYPTLEVLPNTGIQTTTLISNAMSSNPLYYRDIPLAANEDIMVEILTGDDTLSLHRNGSFIRAWSPNARDLRYFIFKVGLPTVSGVNPYGLVVYDDNGDLTFSSTEKLISIRQTIPQNNFGYVRGIYTTGPITCDSDVNFFTFNSYPPQRINIGGTTIFVASGIHRISNTTYEIKNEIFGSIGTGLIPMGSGMYFGPTNGFLTVIV